MSAAIDVDNSAEASRGDAVTVAEARAEVWEREELMLERRRIALALGLDEGAGIDDVIEAAEVLHATVSGHALDRATAVCRANGLDVRPADDVLREREEIDECCSRLLERRRERDEVVVEAARLTDESLAVAAALGIDTSGDYDLVAEARRAGAELREAWYAVDLPAVNETDDGDPIVRTLGDSILVVLEWVGAAESELDLAKTWGAALARELDAVMGVAHDPEALDLGEASLRAALADSVLRLAREVPEPRARAAAILDVEVRLGERIVDGPERDRLMGRAGTSALTLRPEVRAFARLMEAKLREHDDRPGWNDPTIGDMERDDALTWLLDRLVEEADEVHDALCEYIGDDDDDEEDRRHPDRAKHAAWEAVDVANFAMMIADVLGFPSPPGSDS